jgi:hypothetical protein
MRCEFREAVQEQCPWVLMVIDRFHIIKQATTATQGIPVRNALSVDIWRKPATSSALQDGVVDRSLHLSLRVWGII